MKPGYCETEAEYRISIKLLKEFIISPGAVAAVNGKEGILHHILHYLDNYASSIYPTIPPMKAPITV